MEDMESRPPEIRTYFNVAGDELDPDEFTRIVGTQPTNSRKKGELSPHPALRKQGRTNLSNLWQIKHVENSSTTDEGIQKLLALVWERREAIIEYVKNRSSLTLGILTAVTIYEDRPVYELSGDTIKKLAYLGAEWVMDDIYDHRDESPTEKS